MGAASRTGATDGMENLLLQGRYRLLDPIGRGGMGEVWCARDEALERRVAVKCLKPLGGRGDTLNERVLRERFRREARAAASLQHRGVTVVHDFGEWHGVLYLVMELLDGENLRQVLRARGRRGLPLPELLDIAEQLATALAYTHRQGVVHRDLKPANIVRTADGTVKICDFGIARIVRDIGFTTRIGGSRAAMGTPHYMSPEQIAAEDLDHRSDLYSLGCVLYELATGRPPFDQDDAWSVLLSHRDVPPRPPRTRRPELPADLERLVLDLLAKRAEDRPRDAYEVARRLRAVSLTLPDTTTGPAVLPPGRPGGGAGPPPLPRWARGMAAGLPVRGRRLPAAAAFGPAAALNVPWSGPARQAWALGRHHRRPWPPDSAPRGCWPGSDGGARRWPSAGRCGPCGSGSSAPTTPTRSPADGRRPWRWAAWAAGPRRWSSTGRSPGRGCAASGPVTPWS